MLDSEDLAQLKIQGILQQQKNTQISYSYTDISNVVNSSSSDHIIVKAGSNSNILSFVYVLLSHIFQLRDACSQPNSSLGSGSSPSNSGNSMNTDFFIFSNSSNKIKQSEQNSEVKVKLNKIYMYLFNEHVNLADIKNIPNNIQKALRQYHIAEKNKVNLFLKQKIIQFLKILSQKFQQNKRVISNQNLNLKNNQLTKKQLIIYSSFRKYTLCQDLMIMFVRSILLKQYQITEAIDFDNQISDHTVYTALCDAFSYGSLHIQQNYTQISAGSYIKFVRQKTPMLQNKEKFCKIYIVCLPQLRMDVNQRREMIESDTFRIRRKSSDHTSNNESVSFRQNNKNIYTSKSQQQNQVRSKQKKLHQQKIEEESNLQQVQKSELQKEFKVSQMNGQQHKFIINQQISCKIHINKFQGQISQQGLKQPRDMDKKKHDHQLAKEDISIQIIKLKQDGSQIIEFNNQKKKQRRKQITPATNVMAYRMPEFFQTSKINRNITNKEYQNKNSQGIIRYQLKTNETKNDGQQEGKLSKIRSAFDFPKYRNKNDKSVPLQRNSETILNINTIISLNHIKSQTKFNGMNLTKLTQNE